MPNNWTVDDIHELANDILLQSQGGDVSPDMSDYVGVYALNADLFETVSGNPIIRDEAREQAVMKLTAELPYNADEWTGVTVTRNGFNQWDEEWEIGGIRSDNGQKYADANRIRSKNYIPVLPSTSLYLRIPSGYSGWKVAFYDIDKTFISSTVSNNLSFTTPHNCYYLMIGENGTDYGTTYKNDICLNVSSSRNGEYEPYNGQTYTITFSTEIYGGTLDVIKGKLTSTMAADGSPLPEPVVYQLEPQAVTLADGYNVIFSDAGTLEMSYRR